MAVLSTLSDPRQQVPVTRQHGRNVLNLTQPRAANEYNTVNQLLFAITLFRDLTEIKWFTTTIFAIRPYLHLKCHYIHTAKPDLRREIFASKELS